MRMALVFLTGFLTAAGGVPAELVGEAAPVASAMSVRASTSLDVRPSPSVSIPRADDGLFYVKAGVASGMVRFLVDTGASHVILSHADAALIAGRAVAGPASSIQTAGGRVQVDWVVIDRLEIQGQLLRDVRAAVPEKDVGLSLLGQNALAQFSQLQINGDHLIIHR